MLLMQLVQAQALRVRLIIKAFKATSVQALNMKIYLTSIGFKPNKKADQTISCLCFGLLFHTFIQHQSIHPRQILVPLEILGKRYAKLFNNNVYKLKRKPAYIIALSWQPQTINISNLKKKAIQLHNQLLALKPPLKIVTYIDRSGINEKIDFFSMIQGESKAIKKFLETYTYNKVYMGKLEGIQNLLNYTLS